MKCSSTGVDRARCFHCPPGPPPAPVAPPPPARSATLRQVEAGLELDAKVARRLLKRPRWYALPETAFPVRCVSCLRPMRAGEPVTDVYGRTGRDWGQRGWCCEEAEVLAGQPPSTSRIFG